MKASSEDRDATWLAAGPQARVVYVGLAVVFVCTAVFMVAVMLHARTFIYNDFFAFRSFARFVETHPPSMIYDNDRLGAFQAMSGSKLFAYFYHPGMLLLVWPLAHLPYVVGYVTWAGVGLVVYIAAVCGRDRASTFAILVAPSTVWTIMCGQSSMIVAGLVVGGLRTARQRPLLGGVLLGLATYKPQLGLLVPLALLASRQWRTIAAATVTFGVVMIASSLCFGLSIWPSWYDHVSNIVRVANADSIVWAGNMVMVSTNLMMLGVDPGMAHAVQLVASGLTALFIWRCFRLGSGDLQIAALAAATFLAAPFAFNYDYPLFTASVIVFVNERRQSAGAFRFGEVLVVTAALMLPYCVFTAWLHCFSSLFVLAMAWTIRRRIHSVDRRTMPAVSDMGAAGHGMTTCGSRDLAPTDGRAGPSAPVGVQTTRCRAWPVVNTV